MADSVRYAISVTPVEELTDENSGTHNVISGEVNKALGGSGVAAVTDYSGTAAVQGYKDATVNYVEAIDSTDLTTVTTEATATFVFIKNTGYTFSSATALGAALTASLKVICGTFVVAILDAGECIVLKDDNAGIVASTIYVRTVTTAGANDTGLGHLAVEYLVVD